MRAEHAFIKTISKDSEILKEIQKTEALKKLFLDFRHLDLQKYHLKL